MVLAQLRGRTGVKRRREAKVTVGPDFRETIYGVKSGAREEGRAQREVKPRSPLLEVKPQWASLCYRGENFALTMHAARGAVRMLAEHTSVAIRWWAR